MLGGANITLVARDKAKLESVVNQLKVGAYSHKMMPVLR